MIENENLTLSDFGFPNYDDPSHPDYDDPSGPFYTLDDNGYPLAEEHRKQRLGVRGVLAKMANWTPAQCRAYLVEVGTHNPDGTVAEIYTLPYEYGPFAGKE